MGAGSLFDSASTSNQTAIQATQTTGGDTSPTLSAGRSLTGALALASGSEAVTAGNKSQINILDGGAIPSITQIAEQALGLVQKNNTDLNSTLGDVLTKASDLNAASLANNQLLAANAATGGASTASTTITKILLGFGVFVTLGIALYFSRKK
jgi:hypothetical protein